MPDLQLSERRNGGGVKISETCRVALLCEKELQEKLFSYVICHRGSKEQDVILAFLWLLFFYLLCQVVAVLHLQFWLDLFLAFSVSEGM